MTKTQHTPTFNELLHKMFLYMKPPGNGVYTVFTGKHYKDRLHKNIYQTDDHNAVVEQWKKSLLQIPMNSSFILGIPSDNGGGIHRGANFGPLFLREHLYTQHTQFKKSDEFRCLDLGDVFVNPHLLHDQYLNEETKNLCKKSMYGDDKIHLPVSPLSIAYDFAKSFYELFPQKTIFTIGGDHSTSFPVTLAYFEKQKQRGVKSALIHFDAHTDLSPERLGIDLCFGTWTAKILPHLPSPKHLIQLGIRASAKDRAHWENGLGISQYWAQDIMGAKLEATTQKIIADLKDLGVEELYVTFDIDCLDQNYAGATGTPEPHGPSPFEPMFILQSLFEHFRISGADIMEIAPMVKAPHITQMEPETTLMVAGSFATFLLQAMESKSPRQENTGH